MTRKQDPAGLAPLVSLGLRSDLMVMRGLSTLEHHSDRIVLRTPSEPHYWCGNMVIFRSAHIDPVAQIARFQADFPKAGHVALSWDSPLGRRAPGHAEFAARGFAIDVCDVLTLRGPPNRAPSRAPIPDGIDIRPVSSEAEWAQVVALQIETGVEDGSNPADYAPFIEGRFKNRRRQIADGRGCWFGAFQGNRLVADLGIFIGAGIARFQSVETRNGHRRRGLCAALLCAGADWAAKRAPQAKPVIIADRDSAAGRIYRKRGFARAQSLILVVKGPENADPAAR